MVAKKQQTQTFLALSAVKTIRTGTCIALHAVRALAHVLARIRLATVSVCRWFEKRQIVQMPHLIVLFEPSSMLLSTCRLLFLMSLKSLLTIK